MNWFEQSPAQMICLYERFAFLLQNECIVLAICVIFSCFFLQFIQHMHASPARREIARERESQLDDQMYRISIYRDMRQLPCTVCSAVIISVKENCLWRKRREKRRPLTLQGVKEKQQEISACCLVIGVCQVKRPHVLWSRQHECRAKFKRRNKRKKTMQRRKGVNREKKLWEERRRMRWRTNGEQAKQ